MTSIASTPGPFPTIAFPSVEFFEALADAARADEARFRKLGVSDFSTAFVVGDEAFRLEFVDFGCETVALWDRTHPFDPTNAVDFTIEAEPKDWRELLAHIADHGHADPQHTLNSLVLRGDRFHLHGDEQLGEDNFYRYNATLQAFVDEVAVLMAPSQAPAHGNVL